MKSRSAALVAILAGLCLAAFGSQVRADIGVYFDTAGFYTTAPMPTFTPANVYVILKNSPAASVDGLKVAYAFVGFGGSPNSIYRLSENVYGATGNISSDPAGGQYDITWSLPRPAQTPLVLVSWSLMVVNDQPSQIMLTEIANLAVPDGLPDISSGGTSYGVPVHPACVCWTNPCPSAIANFVCGVPNESASWGAVKGLYR
jgi:hypothetical protein